MTTQTTPQHTCLCGAVATRGRYCENCLNTELEWNTVNTDDLQAAADLYDRLLKPATLAVREGAMLPKEAALANGETATDEGKTKPGTTEQHQLRLDL